MHISILAKSLVKREDIGQWVGLASSLNALVKQSQQSETHTEMHFLYAVLTAPDSGGADQMDDRPPPEVKWKKRAWRQRCKKQDQSRGLWEKVLVRMGGLSLHLPVRRGAGSAQKRPLWRYSDLGELGRQGRHEGRELRERERKGERGAMKKKGFCPTDKHASKGN